jgi:hypothetical protein
MLPPPILLQTSQRRVNAALKSEIVAAKVAQTEGQMKPTQRQQPAHPRNPQHSLQQEQGQQHPSSVDQHKS